MKIWNVVLVRVEETTPTFEVYPFADENSAIEKFNEIKDDVLNDLDEDEFEINEDENSFECVLAEDPMYRNYTCEIVECDMD